jgi:hypothetical protein
VRNIIAGLDPVGAVNSFDKDIPVGKYSYCEYWHTYVSTYDMWYLNQS